MPSENQDLSPDELLERQVERAFLDKDQATLSRLLTGGTVADSLKSAALEMALESGRLDAVRFVLEEVKPVLNDIHCICLVLDACKAQQPEIALYLCEKSAELGLERRDAFTLIFERFAPALHAAAADQLLDYAADKQDALDKMLLAAADAKAFGVLPHLLDRGANPGADHGAALRLLTVSYPPEFFADREKYLGLMEKFLAKFDDSAAIDAALPVTAYKVAGQAQYPALLGMLLSAGADPYGNQQEAKRVLTEGTVSPAGNEGNGKSWDGVFAEAQSREAEASRREFDALFGNTFRLADLCQKINETGDTGFMLAARARLLDRIAAEAVKEGTHGGADLLAAIVETNARNQSALSLAVDRGDAAVLLDPACWTKEDLQAVENRLTPAQAAYAGMTSLFAHFDHHALKEKSAKFKLQPGLRPRPPGGP